MTKKIAAIPVPAVGLLGCALCGLSVGIMWPGAAWKKYGFSKHLLI